MVNLLGSGARYFSLTANLPPLETSFAFSSHFNVGGGSPSNDALNFAVDPSSVNCLRGFTINDGFDSRSFLRGHKDALITYSAQITEAKFHVNLIT